MVVFKIDVISVDFVSQTISLPGARLEIPEYPSAWFIAHPKQKPGIMIPKRLTGTVQWDKVLGHVLHTTVHPNVAILFMSDYIVSKYTAGASSAWTGVSICNQNQTITPLDLLQITNSNIEWTATEGDEVDGYGKFRLFAILLAGYRSESPLKSCKGIIRQLS